MKRLPALFDLNNQVALVTGGAGLLGVEFSRTLSEAGAQTVIADIDGEAAKAAAARLNEDQSDNREKSTDLQRKAISIQVDITSPESVHRMVEVALKEFGRVDILVNSAAKDPKFDSQNVSPLRGDEDRIEKPDPNFLTFEEFPLDIWNQSLEVNLTGIFLCCQAVVKPMLQQGKGVIINISSIYGLVGPDQRIYQNPGAPHQFKPVYYSVTKAGVLGLTRYLATYYAGKGIRVNALSPGGVYNDHDDIFIQAYSARSVLGRMADKAEMNGALLFLASDASSYMTGSNLVVDGGWTAW
jgi:NAD(P)-dependent dehydrogenase (short-subunit alcohol dehydrogenase family)